VVGSASDINRLGEGSQPIFTHPPLPFSPSLPPSPTSLSPQLQGRFVHKVNDWVKASLRSWHAVHYLTVPHAHLNNRQFVTPRGQGKGGTGEFGCSKPSPPGQEGGGKYLLSSSILLYSLFCPLFFVSVEKVLSLSSFPPSKPLVHALWHMTHLPPSLPPSFPSSSPHQCHAVLTRVSKRLQGLE